MRMDKQGKGGSNAVDEEEKRQVRAMDGKVCLRRTCRSENVHASGKKAQSASTNVKANAPTVPLSPLHHNKRNNRQGNQGEYRG